MKARPKPGKPGVCLHCGAGVARGAVGHVHAATSKAACEPQKEGA